MSIKKSYVKFVPFNLNTISSLINKTIKYSTVYDFNDLRELKYIPPHKHYMDSEFKKSFKKNFQEKFSNIVSNKIALSDHQYREDFLEKLRSYIDKYGYNITKYPKDYWGALLEQLAYVSVGIFAVAGPEVFKNDCSQIMFAHYADNLNGLAFIYEINEPNIKKVEYNNFIFEFQELNRIFDWCNGRFEYMHDFLIKSENWKYEQEYRLFGKPGIYSMSENNIELQAILHTSRLQESYLNMLKNISTNLYDGKVEIREIYASNVGGKYFRLKDDNESVSDYISKL